MPGSLAVRADGKGDLGSFGQAAERMILGLGRDYVDGESL